MSPTSTLKAFYEGLPVTAAFFLLLIFLLQQSDLPMKLTWVDDSISIRKEDGSCDWTSIWLTILEKASLAARAEAMSSAEIKEQGYDADLEDEMDDDAHHHESDSNDLKANATTTTAGSISEPKPSTVAKGTYRTITLAILAKAIQELREAADKDECDDEELEFNLESLDDSCHHYRVIKEHQQDILDRIECEIRKDVEARRELIDAENKGQGDSQIDKREHEAVEDEEDCSSEDEDFGWCAEAENDAANEDNSDRPSCTSIAALEVIKSRYGVDLRIAQARLNNAKANHKIKMTQLYATPCDSYYDLDAKEWSQDLTFEVEDLIYEDPGAMVHYLNSILTGKRDQAERVIAEMEAAEQKAEEDLQAVLALNENYETCLAQIQLQLNGARSNHKLKMTELHAIPIDYDFEPKDFTFEVQDLIHQDPDTAIQNLNRILAESRRIADAIIAKMERAERKAGEDFEDVVGLEERYETALTEIQAHFDEVTEKHQLKMSEFDTWAEQPSIDMKAPEFSIRDLLRHDIAHVAEMFDNIIGSKLEAVDDAIAKMKAREKAEEKIRREWEVMHIEDVGAESGSPCTPTSITDDEELVFVMDEDYATNTPQPEPRDTHPIIASPNAVLQDRGSQPSSPASSSSYDDDSELIFDMDEDLMTDSTTSDAQTIGSDQAEDPYRAIKAATQAFQAFNLKYGPGRAPLTRISAPSSWSSNYVNDAAEAMSMAVEKLSDGSDFELIDDSDDENVDEVRLV